VAQCLFWAAVISITFPRMVGAFGSTGGMSASKIEFFPPSHSSVLAFGFYAGTNVIALIMIFFLVPGN
jgi:hypothetical protein